MSRLELVTAATTASILAADSEVAGITILRQLVE
jgi:hypothetical protein